jgi:uncharacterized damage-inducible protein DinB
MTTDPRYPISKFQPPDAYTEPLRKEFIRQIEEAPGALRQAVQGLTAAQLDTPYRDGGWTVRQVVHHVPDSHLNAYVRFKLALTEQEPTIKPYQEAEWAKLPDARIGDVDLSLTLLDGLHRRWVIMLRNMTAEDFQRTYMHPESGRNILDRVLALYAWHGRHHAAQIVALRQRQGW